MASSCTLLPLLLSILTALPWAVSIHCNCEHAKCTTLSEEACPAGTTQDLCGCCTVCAGAAGEECGGPWGIYGDCGVGLECHQDHCPPEDETLECYHYYLTGKCIPRRHRSVILDVLAGPDKTESMKQRHRQRLLRQLELLMK